MLKKISVLFVLPLLVLGITGCVGNVNVEALKKIKTISIPLKTVSLRPSSLFDKAGEEYTFNVDSAAGLDSKMVQTERDFLSLKLSALEKTLTQLNIAVNAGARLSMVPNIKDEYSFVPANAINFDPQNRATIQTLCSAGKVDGLGSINLYFAKVFYDDPYYQSYIKIRAKVVIKLYAQTGEQILLKVITADSTTRLEHNFKVNMTTPVLGANGLVFQPAAETQNDPALEEYLDKSFNLRNNFGPLYEEALNNLILNIQNELAAVKNQYL